MESSQAEAAAGELPARSPAFSTLLYRYFFFEWLFRDCAAGSLLERSAAWRHNRRHARWLPRYLKRWVLLGSLLYGLGALVELALQSQLLSALFYVSGVMTAPVNAVIAVGWLGLKLMPPPH